MKTTSWVALCGVLVIGCSADPPRDGTSETQEIVDNLVQAGFPIDDIQIVDGMVYTGRDALVTLQVSREMLQTDGQTEEQYRTRNQVSRSVRRICVNPSASFAGNGALMQGLNNAVANYNALPLTFDFAVGPTTGCDANISITTWAGTGGQAGFPSGGQPFPGPVYIGTAIPTTFGPGPTQHVIEHELGHCIGLRHSDFYNRAISCGGSATNEGDAEVGAILIPGTPSTAVNNGSVYNSCYNAGSTGVFTDSDITALTRIYALRGDHVALIRPGEGSWGHWWPGVYCADGSWAIGYRMRVESSQGGGLGGGNDDTALNSVQLLCRNPTTLSTQWISSYDGNWGSWHASSSCGGLSNYLTGARMRIEPPQGSGDDTAANDVEFSCTDSSTRHASGGQGWGSWLGWAACPANSAVCGLAVRFEESQGGGDDTGMNGLELECCNVSCNSTCGNHACDTNCESPQTCPSDCGSCGDGSCSVFENRWSCPGDCSYCGDSYCTGNETLESCPSDCGWCGDGICSSVESSSTCPSDCGSPCLLPPCPYEP